DDALSTQALACTCKKIVAPCMNTRMLNNAATMRNIDILRRDGFTIIEPFSGLLACGDIGDGKLPDDATLFAYVDRGLNENDSLKGKEVLVTAGATRESLDPVRFITNHASGKMGFAMAHECMLRGAHVTVIAGAHTAPPPYFVDIINVSSAMEMFDAVREISQKQDIIIKAAAVADYTPLEVSCEKIKKSDGELSLKLKRTTDILKFLGEKKNPPQFLVGFSMETQNMVENSQKKLEKKNADMIVANNIKVEGAGFATDTNVVTLITRDFVRELPKMTKQEAAKAIMDEVILRISK
ncbi:MAG: bifunctional phosphopantothenoylcysteine decarboxylase/phosphopantothenate--cysteine ligase CoaBC, partial [Oscillospiraceae bacterium]